MSTENISVTKIENRQR